MKGLALGQRAQTERLFTAGEVQLYRALTGDAGLAPAPGQRSAVPGPLLAALFSQLLGTRLPGPGTNWLKLAIGYPAPAYVGERLTAVVEISRLRPEKALVNLRATCTGPTGAVVAEGEVLVLVRDLVADAGTAVGASPSDPGA